MAGTTSSGGALEGIRVVEMGQLIAGPFCGQLLGDMGAEIVKLEPPEAGDQMRNWGQGDKPSWWRVIARNKYSVACNLRAAEGQQLARDLIAKADILIENFRPGTLEKWNLDPADLCAVNPGLIVVRVSGYGQTGPYSARAGFGGIGEARGDGAVSSVTPIARLPAWACRSAIRLQPAMAVWERWPLSITAARPAKARLSIPHYMKRYCR